MMKPQCNTERRGLKPSCACQHTHTKRALSARTHAHTISHVHTFCSADHVVLMDFQREGTLLPNVKQKREEKKKLGLCCHAGDGIKQHTYEHTKLWRNVVSLHSFKHVCESIYHLFLPVTSSRLTCRLCSVGVYSNNTLFFWVLCSKREK